MDPNILALLHVVQILNEHHALYASAQLLSKTIDHQEWNDKEVLVMILGWFGHVDEIKSALYEQLYRGVYANCSKDIRRAILCHLIERPCDIRKWYNESGQFLLILTPTTAIGPPNADWTTQHWLLFYKLTHDLYLTHADRDILSIS